MKFFYPVLIGLFLVGCTQSNNQSDTSSQEPVIELQAKSGVVTGVADFGEFLPTASAKLLTFKVLNDGDETLQGPPTLDNADFAISYHNCATLAPKKSCQIKVSFNPKGRAAEVYTSNLNLDSVFVALTAEVLPLPGTTTSSSGGSDGSSTGTPVAASQFLMGSTVITEVDYGTITDKQSLLKTITVKNIGSIALNQAVTLADTKYTLSYDTCSNKTIAAGKTCSLKITLSGAGKSGNVDSSLTYAGGSLNLKAIVNAPVASTGGTSGGTSGGGTSLSNMVYLQGTTLLDPALADFGSFTVTQNKQLIINIKNTGTMANVASTAVLTGTDFSIPYNQCVNKVLAPNSSCQMRVVFSATGKAAQVYTGSITFDNKVLNLTATVTAEVQCPSDQHKEGSVCVANVQSCDEVPLHALIATKTWTGSAYGACQIVSCIGTHHKEGNACVDNVIACNPMPSNATVATQTWNGSAYGTCSVSNCLPGFDVVAGSSCEAQAAGNVMARQMLVFGDSSVTPKPISTYSSNGRFIFVNDQKAYVVLAQSVAPFQQYIMKAEKVNGSFNFSYIYNTGSGTNYTARNIRVLENYKLFNKPVGPYVYFTEYNQSSNTQAIIRLNYNTDEVTTLFTNLRSQVNAVDLAAMVAYTGSSSQRFLQSATGSDVATFTSSTLASKGLLLNASGYQEYLSDRVVFKDGRMYMDGRRACSNYYSNTLFYCDLSEASANTCGSTTEPFVKIMNADIKDPMVNSYGGMSCSSGFKAVQLVGNKVFFDAYSPTSGNGTNILFSYNTTNGAITKESQPGKYFREDGSETTYQNGDYSSYQSYDYESFLNYKQPVFVITRQQRFPSSPSLPFAAYYPNDSLSQLVLLESFDVSDMLTDDVRSNGNVDATTFFGLVNYNAGAEISVVNDNQIMYYRKSLSTNEQIGMYNDYWGSSYLLPYNMELVSYNLLTNEKIVSEPYLIDKQYNLPFYIAGYNKALVKTLVTSFNSTDMYTPPTINTAKGPMLSLANSDWDVAVTAEDMMFYEQTYKEPSLMMDSNLIFTAAPAYNGYYTNGNTVGAIDLYYLSDSISIPSGLEFLSPAVNPVSIPMKISSQKVASASQVNISKLATSELYEVKPAALSNPTVQFRDHPSNPGYMGSSSFGSGAISKYFYIDYSQWDGNPVNLSFEYKTKDSNQIKTLTLPVNATCGTGASWIQSNKECACTDSNNQFYSGEYCANKCNGGVWNNSNNTCACDDPSYVYQPGSGPNGQGGSCIPQVNCSEPWNLYWGDCTSCGYYWDEWSYQCYY